MCMSVVEVKMRQIRARRMWQLAQTVSQLVGLSVAWLQSSTFTKTYVNNWFCIHYVQQRAYHNACLVRSVNVRSLSCLLYI